jgi:drug/metabolite transporter (DMT)-like permease
MLGIKHDRLAGMAAMLIGVAAFSLMDTGIKLLTANYSMYQVAALRGLAALPVVFAWALYAGGAAQLLRIRWPLHLVRGVLSVGMMITFSYAVGELTLTNAYVLFFVAPLMITVLSVLLLKERIRLPQWLVVVVGFSGVLIATNPDASGFALLGSIAILCTAFCYALSSVLVKILGRTDSTQSMMFWMTCMLAIGATLVTLLVSGWRPIVNTDWPIIGGVAVTGAIGQWGITEAFKRAPAASVAPLEYSGLAWVMIIDLLVWAQLPTWRTLAGAALIIGSGLYLLRYESLRTAQSSKPPIG